MLCLALLEVNFTKERETQQPLLQKFIFYVSISLKSEFSECFDSNTHFSRTIYLLYKEPAESIYNNLQKKKMEKRQTPTIVLFGRTGAGKSALANQIVGQKFFVEGDTLTSETFQTTSYTGITRLDKTRNVTVIDTPGFADNRKGLDFANILQNILEFLTTLKGGFNVALYLLPSSKQRFDRHDQDELTLLGRLLGDDCFNHTFIVLTQLDEFNEKKRKEIIKRAQTELPPLLKEQSGLDFDSSKILFSDFDDFEPFLKRLNEVLKQCPAYTPKIAADLDVHDPQSVKKFLASKEMKELQEFYESKLEEHKRELEAVRKSYKSLENITEAQRKQLERNEEQIRKITQEAETWKQQKQEMEA